MRAALLLLLLAGCSSDFWLGPHIGGVLARLAGQPPTIQATSLTPIIASTIGSGASGLTGVADRYDVSCTVLGGTVTLYPAVHDGSKWTVNMQQPCTMDSSVVTEGSCTFGAYRAAGLTWNVYKTGAGSVASCIGAATSNLVTPPMARAASGGGGGSSSPTLYTTNLGDNGDVKTLGGTNISSGRVIGYCKHITTASGDTTNVSLLAVAFNEDEGAGPVIDTTGDTTGTTIVYGTGAVDIASAPLVLGFTRVCKHWVIPAT